MESYRRFYALLNRLPYIGDREEFKSEMIHRCTLGRTRSLREMTEREYNDCCAALEKMLAPEAREVFVRERKRWRSAALHQLQLYGVDTTDWVKVNEFCKQPRIAGKEFRDLDCEELEALTTKMRVILRRRSRLNDK